MHVCVYMTVTYQIVKFKPNAILGALHQIKCFPLYGILSTPTLLIISPPLQLFRYYVVRTILIAIAL